MNDGLIKDWLIFIDNTEESDWAYNWDYNEGSTANPRSIEGCATLFLTINADDDPIVDFVRYIDTVNMNRRRNEVIECTIASNDENSKSKRRYIKLRNSKDGNVLDGYLTCGKNGNDIDPNVGNYAVLTSKNKHDYELIMYLKATTSHGYSALIDHSDIDIPLLEGIHMHVLSGYGPAGREEEEGCNQAFHPDSLATRFAIVETESKKEIARCHLSYRDGSSDPSVGPTIDMIAVHKQYRGQNYLPLLWAWVKKFIQENFTLECMSTATEPGHIMIKAQQLSNAIIEKRTNKKGKIMYITVKGFCYQFAGFFFRDQIFASHRPTDEEAVLYIPLLSKQHLRESASSILQPLHYMKWKRNLGSVACHSCDKFGLKHSLCTGCELVYYCSKNCQKYDWKQRHKIWCGKTRDEVIPILTEKGCITKTPDGKIALKAYI